MSKIILVELESPREADKAVSSLKLRVIVEDAWGGDIHEDSVRLPHNPTPKDVAQGLRVLSDWLERKVKL